MIFQVTDSPAAGGKQDKHRAQLQYLHRWQRRSQGVPFPQGTAPADVKRETVCINMAKKQDLTLQKNLETLCWIGLEK